MASLVNENGNKLVVQNGYHKKRIIQTSCGNIEVKLPRLDDRKADEKFISKILPPFVRKTPTEMIRDMHMTDTKENALKAL